MKGATFKRCGCSPVTDAEGRRVACRKRHGTWWYSHDLPPGADGSRRRTRTGGFPTQKAAAEAMQESMSAFARGDRIEPVRMTVAEFFEQWVASKGTLRSSTRRSYEEHIRLYFKPGLGHLRLADLRDHDVERLYAAMRQLGQEPEGRPSDVLRRLLEVRSEKAKPRPLTAARIRRVHATLLSAMNTAVRRKLIAFNPSRHIELASGRRPRAVVWTDERVAVWKRTGKRPPVAVWTAEQAGTFLDGALRDRLYPVLHLIAYRGLRRGEAVGLRWEDVDLDARSMQIAQQIVQLGWATEVGAPKTDSGARTVSLDQGTVAVLRRWRQIQQAESRILGAGWCQTGYVFTREDGTPLHPDVASDGFQRLVRTAGLPPIRLHDLRHTAASLALQAGVPMKVVSEQLGHSSLAITADTYTSILPAVARAAAEAVAGVIPRRPRTPPDPPVSAPATIRPQSEPGEVMIMPGKGEKLQVRGGGPRGDRTRNPRIKSPLLCQLS
jgi:integrase